jgi:integrase
VVLRGLRRGELFGLRWSGADLENGVLAVDHSILELDGHLQPGVPKTAAGVRRVFLDAETAALLREHRKAQLAARLRAGADWEDHDLIFCRDDGRPSVEYRRIRRLAADAGVPVITLHEAGRHTSVSMMHDDAGVREDIRMREVGHADPGVHARYNHILDARTARPPSRWQNWSGGRGTSRDRGRMSPGCRQQARSRAPADSRYEVLCQVRTGAPPGT